MASTVQSPSYSSEKAPVQTQDHEPQLREINETGHVQELERNFSLLSVCSVGLVTGNTWAALGGSIVVAIYNGGPPGLLYEFIVVSIFYWLVAASIAELASSMPSSAGVYHWASITPGPRYGPICGWFAGWWNTFAWMMGSASTANICGQMAVCMYGIYHPNYSPERWHVFIGYLVTTWTWCSIVLFANRALPMINNIGLFFIIGGVFVTIVVCAIMPHVTGSSYASSSFVWADWDNQTGYSSNGFVFLAGMLNGAYSVGTPDCVSHLAEELPQPKRNIPLAIAAQMGIGFLTAFFYMIAIFYAISSVTDVFDAPYFPLATIYAQATSSTYITSGRCLWTIARDGAVPFPNTLGSISPRFKNPFNATLFCGCFSTILGAIYVGSSTAFNAFVGSFVVLSTLSYLASILPFMFTGRFSHSSKPLGQGNINGMIPGWFKMGHLTGLVVNGISCVYIVVFVVIYCLPYSLPVTAANMNYASLISGTITLVAGAWWVVGGKGYVGPQPLVHMGEEQISNTGIERVRKE